MSKRGKKKNVNQERGQSPRSSRKGVRKNVGHFCIEGGSGGEIDFFERKKKSVGTISKISALLYIVKRGGKCL